jgi:hypothetical protein
MDQGMVISNKVMEI